MCIPVFLQTQLCYISPVCFDKAASIAVQIYNYDNFLFNISILSSQVSLQVYYSSLSLIAQVHQKQVIQKYCSPTNIYRVGWDYVICTNNALTKTVVNFVTMVKHCNKSSHSHCHIVVQVTCISPNYYQLKLCYISPVSFDKLL